ncbi:MAG: hypothetical protein ABIP08_04200 [Lautropia sp.]
MKYSPGFEDPSARPRLAGSRSFVVAATLLGVGVLGIGAVAVLGLVEFEAILILGTRLLGLR